MMTFRCDVCNIKFHTIDALKEHLQKDHSSTEGMDKVKELILWFQKHGHTAAVALLHSEQCGANRGPEKFQEAYDELRKLL